MCQFMSTAEMPKMSSKGSSNGNGDGYISLFIKPNKDNEMYRFRLLWYKQSSKNDRNTPYFAQMIHDHWGKTDKGVNIVDDTVVCPATKYVHYDEDKYIPNEKTGKKQLNCPICRKANEAFNAWKFSGYKDKMCMHRYMALKAKYRMCVPVFVINDPNNPKNNGKFKVIFFTNKEEGERFDNLVNEEKTKAYLASQRGEGYEIFNGGANAVDFYLRMEVVPELRNQGKENEYTANVRKITNMAFGKKAHPIPQINKEAIDAFGFDDSFYVSNTKSELDEFYHKYYGQDDIDTPEEEIDVFDNPQTGVSSSRNGSVTETVSISNPVKEESTELVSDKDLDDVLAEEPSKDVAVVQDSLVEDESKSEDDTPNKDEIGLILDDIGV